MSRPLFDPLPLLYDALRAQYGIILRTSAVPALRQRLHLAKRASSDERLRGLHFVSCRTEPAAVLYVLNPAGYALFKSPPTEAIPDA